MAALRLWWVAALLIALATAALFASDRTLPKPISSELPVYPERARAARVAGNVTLWFVLNGRGEVTQAEVVSGNPLLREAALRNVKSWKFRPQSVAPNVRYETDFVYVLEVQAENGEPNLTVSMRDSRRVQIITELYVEAIEARPYDPPPTPDRGFVPDESTAISIAEAVLSPIYGAAKIRNERPFTATLDGDVWTVRGSLPKAEPGEFVVGGVAVVEISKRSGRLLRLGHGK